MSLKYEPSSEPIHNSARKLFLNREIYRTVQLSAEESPLLRTSQQVGAKSNKPQRQEAATPGTAPRLESLDKPLDVLQGFEVQGCLAHKKHPPP